MGNVLDRRPFSRALAGVYDFIEQHAGVSKVGAKTALTGMTVAESGGGTYRTTTFTFRNTPAPLIDTAATVARCALKIYDFPAGLIGIVGAVSNLALTKSAAGVNADWDGDFALGTVAAAADATLSSTEQNVIPTTPTPQAAAGATTAKGISTATEAFKLLDGTDTAIDLYLNLLVDDADQDVTTTPTNLILNGTVTVSWLALGDK